MTLTATSAPVNVNLPHFVTLALEVLPSFLEALGGSMRLKTYRALQYLPDLTKVSDPDCGEVTFRNTDEDSITFHFRYRVGEEGTPGSLSRIEKLVIRKGERSYAFDYVEHFCFCRVCRGIKFPFRPSGMNRHRFEEISEEERLQVIRAYIATK